MSAAGVELVAPALERVRERIRRAAEQSGRSAREVQLLAVSNRTDGAGTYCTTQQEDNATRNALERAAAAGRANLQRLAVLRTAGHTTYCYTAKRTWIKVSKSNYSRCLITVGVSKGKWALGVKGLKKGVLVVTAASADWADQASKVAIRTAALKK